MKKSWSLKFRLVMQFLFVGLVPMACVALVSYLSEKQALQKVETKRFDGISAEKQEGIKLYFSSIKSLMSTFARDKMIVDAARDFRKSFFSFADEKKLTDVQISAFRNDLKTYYSDEFAKEFSKQNDGKDADVVAKLNRLDRNGVALQHAFISKNPNPLGSKHKLDSTFDGTTYNAKHAELHPIVRLYLEEYGLYDVFLVDIATGQIIYTVFKELDFATSLTSGAYSTTNLGNVFKRVASESSSSSDVKFADFEQYPPSYMAPASFVGAPIYDGDKKIAVAIFQLPLDKITQVMSGRLGLGQTGEVYLVGPDKLLRSDTFLGKDTFTVTKSYRNPAETHISSPEIDLALSGKSGNVLSTNYLQQDVFTSFRPVEVFDQKWAVIAQMGKAEALEEVNDLMWMIIGLALVVSLLVSVAGFQIARSISTPISNVVTDLQLNASTLAQASQDLARSSALISDQTSEQASAIEETAASIEQISAMVKNNVDQAEKSAALSHEVENVAQAGNRSMEQLVLSMEDIIRSNEDIQHLVKVIGEIGEKTKIIDEIVFQTKLLSFNASVEAERAGEHGRGFAVVAQEVGNLAQMSGRAALEIASMVKDSIKKTEVITSTSKNKVMGGHALVIESAKHLQEIARSAQTLAKQAEQIVTSSKEQSDGIVQINEAMAQLDQTTQQNAQTADETAAASEELNGQAGNLSENVQSLLKFISGSLPESAEETTIPSAAETEKKDVQPPASNNLKIIPARKRPNESKLDQDYAEIKVAVGEAIGSRISSVSTSEDSWDRL